LGEPAERAVDADPADPECARQVLLGTVPPAGREQPPCHPSGRRKGGRLRESLAKAQRIGGQAVEHVSTYRLVLAADPYFTTPGVQVTAKREWRPFLP
jgi:hypothetical protein